MAEFDKNYWEARWSPSTQAPDVSVPVNPYLPVETSDLRVGTALDAGCGAGAEALWLAQRAWEVTAVDISAMALSAARDRATRSRVTTPVEWVEADLGRWEPGRTWDLVMTHYAHASIGQLRLYERLSSWVAPGGTLLIVAHAHRHEPDGAARREHPDDAMASVSGISSVLAPRAWSIASAYESSREVHAGGHARRLDDVVVRATRLA